MLAAWRRPAHVAAATRALCRSPLVPPGHHPAGPAVVACRGHVLSRGCRHDGGDGWGRRPGVLVTAIRVATRSNTAWQKDIKAASLRVIGPDGTNLGERPREEAIADARSQGLVLFRVSSGEVPVYRMMTEKEVDDKQIFLEKKKTDTKEQSKNAKKGQQEFKSQGDFKKIKEVQLGVHIQQNDYSMKAKRAIQFLAKGWAVKFVIKHKRGHGKFEAENQRILLDTVTRDLANIGIPDSKVSTKGIQSTLFFVPDPNYKPDADESTT